MLFIPLLRIRGTSVQNTILPKENFAIANGRVHITNVAPIHKQIMGKRLLASDTL